MERDTPEQSGHEPQNDMFVVASGDEAAVIVNQQMQPDGAVITTDVIGAEGVVVNAFIGETDPDKLAPIRRQLAARALGHGDVDYDD